MAGNYCTALQFGLSPRCVDLDSGGSLERGLWSLAVCENGTKTRREQESEWEKWKKNNQMMQKKKMIILVSVVKKIMDA